MATITGALAWSVPVPADVLVAHVGAYVKLHSKSGAIHGLRLCHRYGKGDRAAITKLPAELVLEVEGYLMEDERTTQRKKAEREFKCFEDRCNPSDHLSEDEQREAYVMYFEGCPCCDPDEDFERVLDGVREGRDLSAAQKWDMDSLLAQEDAYDWMEEHRENLYRWDSQNGRLSMDSRSRTLLSDFGLESFTTNTQPKTGKPGQRKTKGVYQSTISYLTFPCDKFKEEVTRPDIDESDCDTGLQYLHGEAGFEIGVAPPKQLSVKDIARFARACRILDIAPVLPSAPPSKIIAAAPGDHTKDMGKEEVPGDENESKVCAPKLRLLLDATVNSEGLDS